MTRGTAAACLHPAGMTSAALHAGQKCAQHTRPCTEAQPCAPHQVSPRLTSPCAAGRRVTSWILRSSHARAPDESSSLTSPAGGQSGHSVTRFSEPCADCEQGTAKWFFRLLECCYPSRLGQSRCWPAASSRTVHCSDCMSGQGVTGSPVSTTPLAGYLAGQPASQELCSCKHCLTHCVRNTPLLLLPSARSLRSPGSPLIRTVDGCSWSLASCTMAAALAASMNCGNTTILGYQLRICTQQGGCDACHARAC